MPTDSSLMGRHHCVPNIRAILITLILVQFHLLAAGHGHHHGHHHHPDHQPALVKDGPVLDLRSESTTAQDENSLIAQALSTLRLLNKARIENPSFNKQEMRPADKEPKLAPPLDYGQNSSSARIFSSGKLASNSTSPYSIPEKIREAARKVAESTPQIPKGDHSEVAAAIKQKYRSNNNDTNAPEPLEPPDGKLGQWATNTPKISSKVTERDSGYWMVDMAKRGQSPFAPSGYKVWRNVQDYGAKGDGKTDDTAAINKAISDGGRCGPDCGSSSIYPATIYFPPGTYLVSSSIIQYYNTEFLGDPINVPTILAASSFVGLGVMTSDVYVSDDESWYINTSNFLRSIRNFKIDIRNTDPTAYICGIHWQVAQASSLENIEFYMLYNSDVPQNTQQGIYMENGSGGFLAELTFVGGNFGAYFGNQQFTTSRLVFVNCKTAVQVHWDWAWTMHDFIIESCGTGLVIIGGAGGPMSTGQGVGSLILVDSIIANTPEGIVTSLVAENSTSFLLQNVGFFNVQTAIRDSVKNNEVLLPGGNELVVESWGFGKISNATTDADGKFFGRESFINGGNIPTMARSEVLLGGQKDKMGRDLFTRRRPKYHDVPQQRVMDVMALGAKGDGKTDDTPVLNAILDGAANTSSVVYFPHGVYIIKGTLRIPVGSRIIGQAWPQIMMSEDPNFLDEKNPQVGVQVGRLGEQGIVEIQGMMFSHSGATAGLIMMEWNVKESTQGSAGMWDSHFRVGGAIGTKMLLEDCPKKTGSINPKCKGASLMMHLTPESSAYLENIWIWVADHDLDKKSQDQIDVFVGRGLLVESTHAWLWGTSVEHAVLYQYQLSKAKNILLGMIQTESPYFQPVPPAPQPFETGLFPNDPTFTSCANNNEKGCATSWAVRIVDSSAIYMLGAGIYSWFYDYSKTCEDSRNCQQRAFEVEQSSDIWIYNLCTFAIVEMISPLGSIATKAADNVNGFLSSILAWLQGAERTSGEREFEGFQVYDAADIAEMRNKFPDICNTALTQRIDCESTVEGFAKVSHHGTLGNETLTDLVCQAGCGKSLDSWYYNVKNSCSEYKLDNGALPVLLGARMYAGYNETCLKDMSTGRYCNDIISEFTVVHNYTAMPESELCHSCYVKRHEMMVPTPYSTYDDLNKERLQYIYRKCNLKGSIIAQPQAIPEIQKSLICLSDTWRQPRVDDTCDKIALLYSVASAAIFMGNQNKIFDCNSIPIQNSLCIPLACEKIYTLQDNDTCIGIERDHYEEGVRYGDVRLYNPWVDKTCSNLLTASQTYGRVICLTPQNGVSNETVPDTVVTRPGTDRPGWLPTPAPENAIIAEGTTDRCSSWYTVTQTDDGRTTCPFICVTAGVTIDQLLEANPSLGKIVSECSRNLKPGLTYCTLKALGVNAEEDEAV